MRPNGLVEGCYSPAPERAAGLWPAFVLQNQSGRKYELSEAPNCRRRQPSDQRCQFLFEVMPLRYQRTIYGAPDLRRTRGSGRRSAVEEPQTPVLEC
jgi:hypothetical protein